MEAALGLLLSCLSQSEEVDCAETNSSASIHFTVLYIGNTVSLSGCENPIFFFLRVYGLNWRHRN